MKKFRYLNKDEIDRLPKTAGVYAFKKGSQLLYIGKAANLRERIKQHQELLNRVKQLGYIKTDSEIEALILEAGLIKKYQPRYNTLWKDDKNYFYAGITKEEFPRVFITHQLKNRSRVYYVGPFVDGKKLKRIIKDLRKSFPYRTCKTLPRKPCLWYFLEQCPAPCLFRSRRIEACDISNIQGKEAAGSVVTFINGKPDKNFYRRFKIKTQKEPNDIAMLKEVLSRRLKHAEWGLPDVILVDGGKAQLNAAVSITKIPVMALAKKRNELYMKNLAKPILLKKLPRETFNLILQLRDEAHRFARSYHHKLRDGIFVDQRKNKG